MKSTVTAAVAALFALVGCAENTLGLAGNEKSCPALKDTMISVQNGTEAVPDQQTIYVCKPNIKITWYLNPAQTSQYEFHDDSIFIKDPDNIGEFSNCRGPGNGGEVGPDKNLIKCHDKKDKSPPIHAYKYDIKVYLKGSAATDQPVAKYDPIIVND